MLSEGFYVAAMQSCPCHSVSVDRQPNLVCAVMRRPIMQLFQARGISFIWGRARKAMFSGTVGGNTIWSCPKSNVFRHEGSVSYVVVPGKQRFQARGISFICGRVRKAMFSGTVWGNTIGSCPERFVFWSSGHLG